MDNSPSSSSSSSSRQNELVESMFKSLNSYTAELQQELETVNRKLADQVRIEQSYDASQEQLHDDLIKLRAAIDTNAVKRAILDRNLNERTALSQSLHDQIVEQRHEQQAMVEKAHTLKCNHHRTIAKITEQCANLTMAFRTNYHAYARANLDEIRQKTQIRLKTIADEVSQAEEALAKETTKLGEFNDQLERDSLHLACLKASIDIIATKLRIDSDEIKNTEPLDKQLAEVQNLIDELEAWHSRTDYPSAN